MIISYNKLEKRFYHFRTSTFARHISNDIKIITDHGGIIHASHVTSGHVLAVHDESGILLTN